ncbi:MAG TPA: FAD-binding oxidoreductase [Pyrinomonadaceae bacterium]|nr:FAD-binding oxidoreductase [Pyrinomonadaceae bacterium]
MRPFDLVVIGAGIVGAMTACLARQQKPGWSILLVDRSLVGDGATKYSVGLDIPYGFNAAQKDYSRLSTEIFSDLSKTLPEMPVHELPFFGIVSDARVEAVRNGFTTETIRVATASERIQLHESYPDLVIADDQALLTGCVATYGFPSIATALIVNRLRQQQHVECWEGVEIESVEPGADGFQLTTGDGRVVAARRVVAATGPWLLDGPTRAYAAEAGVRIKKVAALHVDRRPSPRDPVLMFFDQDAFLLPVVQRKQWLFSFTSQEWDCPPEVSRLRVSNEDRQLALSVLARYCPLLVSDCQGGRVFCDAYTPERVPLVARVPGMTDFVVAGACSGSGYRLAPAVALKALEHFA